MTIFWRIAYRLYPRRKPSIRFELFTIGFMGFMAFIYAYAVSVNPTTGNAFRLLIALLIVVVGFAHRQVRLECEKGPWALYGKAMSKGRK